MIEDINRKANLVRARWLTRALAAFCIMAFVVDVPRWLSYAVLAINACVWLIWTIEITHEIDLLTLRDKPIKERRDA